MNYNPFSNAKIFDCLWNGYRCGKPDEMICILSKVMWRTSKKNVEHEIDIPMQKEVVHEIDMTDLQKCFYQQVHLATIPQFQKSIQDYLLRNGNIEWTPKFGQMVGKRVVDSSMKDKFLYQLNNATIKKFLEPLRQLRQDCTIPSIMHQSNDQTRTKQTLRPEQLHEHLVAKTSLEAKSSLRTICSSLNGIAAIRIAQERYDDAINIYEQVLQLAKDYKDVVCVDSMLQIHVYHNLIEIATITGCTKNLSKNQTYSEEMDKMEWKYLSNYYEKVKEINIEIEDHIPELVKSLKEYCDENWWRDIFLLRRSGEDEKRFMDVINVEVYSAIVDSSNIIEQLKTTYGIQLIITEWIDKIQKSSRDVTKRFKSFDFIVKRLRPSNEMSIEDKEKVSNLAKAALSCHLNFLEDSGHKTSSAKNSNKTGLCEICKLKIKLNLHECILFNKVLIDDTTEGTWNPRLEEKLLKSILIYAKRSDFEDETIIMGNKFFKYLEALKTQFKIYAKLWVEINYTTSAIDELNMCKTRLQVVESNDEITEENARYRLKITRSDIENQLQILNAQKQEADMHFIRLNGRLKYLDHLKGRSESTCPICTNQPEERYFVFICGHSICSECYCRLVKNRNNFINCPVCRTSQEIKNIYEVTCRDNPSSEAITGSFSPKIDAIIRLILCLKKEEPDVKILIFSHWDKILEAIATGLSYNGIKYRASFTSNFMKQVQEFKDFSLKVTCLLLNLKYGGKGLNLIEATQILFVEPILNVSILQLSI